MLVYEATDPNQLRRRTGAACIVLAALSSWYFFYWLAYYLRRDPVAMFLGSSRGLWGALDFNLDFYAIWLSVLATIPLVTRPLEEPSEGRLKQAWAKLTPPSVSARVLSWVFNVSCVLMIVLLLGAILWHRAGPYEKLLWGLTICLLTTRVFGLRLGTGLAGILLIATVLAAFTSESSTYASFVEPLKSLSASLSQIATRPIGYLVIVLPIYALLTILCFWITGVPLWQRVLSRKSRLFFVFVAVTLLPLLVFWRASLAVRLAGLLPILTSFWILWYVARALVPDKVRAAAPYKWLLWGVAICFVTFVVLLPETPGLQHPEISDLFPLLSRLDGLYKYIPLVAILGWLRIQRSNVLGSLTPQEMELGRFSFSIYLVGYTATWLAIIPLPLVVGYLLASFWLLIPRESTKFEGNKKDALNNIIATRWGDSVARRAPRP